MNKRTARQLSGLLAVGVVCATIFAVRLATAPAPHPARTAAPTHGTSVDVHGTPPITAGDSKADCITANTPGGVLTQSTFAALRNLTGVTFNCVNTFNSAMPSWTAWERPWMFSDPRFGYLAWLAADPAHQVILTMDLIPAPVSAGTTPLTWERACANGAYDQHAAALAKNLVSYGAGNTVIRLGAEGNGTWEHDYVGSTSTEMADWAKCYDNEVTAMRSVAGTDFLFVWNPNVCTDNLPLAGWYPGDSYVSIIGADAYDEDCVSRKTVGQEGWQAFATESKSRASASPNFPSLDNIESFAIAHGKPMSFPEWGLDSGRDDPAYVTDMANMFFDDDFAYQSYFDNGDKGTAALGSSISRSTAAYQQVYG
jgi:hypothetical protein